jgi:hypothetical protein
LDDRELVTTSNRVRAGRPSLAAIVKASAFNWHRLMAT